MKSKRRFLSLFIFVAAAAAVFAFGWLQLFIEADSCGIMVSKTSGTYGKIIKTGEFTWRWEHLIPKNTKIIEFDSCGKTFSVTSSGTLASADVYSSQVPENPDFSYQITYLISLNTSEEEILNLYNRKIINSQEELNAFLEQKAQSLADRITSAILSEGLLLGDEINILNEEKLLSLKESAPEDFKNISINSIKIASSRIPDVELYRKLKDSYFTFVSELDGILKLKAQEHAQDILDDSRILDRLEKFAGLMEKYPSLAEISKSSDISQVMKVLSDIK
ncbi:hypothetical protein [Treponema sp.]|uniref:hypothetical protein n=1 Tax=Treponema sp. TaxID=166 RepID=UPI002579F0A6|nr:hypothetical protein [Treponema sp.]MBE6353937.1 hypothetical protein [Treponema sp.]